MRGKRSDGLPRQTRSDYKGERQQVFLRLTQEEHTAVKIAAAKARLPMGEFARQVLFGERDALPPPEDGD